MLLGPLQATRSAAEQKLLVAEETSFVRYDLTKNIFLT
jgi:hypothetical protein